MAASLESLLLALMSEGPELFSDAESLVTSIGTGEGGLGKIANVTQNLSTLAGHVATALVTVHTAQSSAPAPATVAAAPATATVASASGG